MNAPVVNTDSKRISNPESKPVLVTAATGRQGGATARALLASGSTPVRVLVRDPNAANARALAALGAHVAVGDLNDPVSLRAACAGVRAVFSMQAPIVSATSVDFSKEVQQGTNLIEAALLQGVDTFVHTATSGVGDHRRIEGWAEGRWKAHEVYWENKLATCERVRAAGFNHWTIILPATFMDHAMLEPSNFVDGRRLVTVMDPDRAMGLIAPEDVGRTAAAALTQPDVFHGVTLQLAGDVLTLAQVVAILSRLDGKEYVVETGTVEQAVNAGVHPGVVEGQRYMNVAPVLAHPELARAYGLSPIDFETWARTVRER